MRTYYRGPDAVVTSDIFAGSSAPTRTFAIHDLRNVCITRTDVENFRPGALHVSAGLLLIAVAAWPLWKASPLLALGLVALGMPAFIAGAVFWRLRPQRWELRATYRGADVALFTSSDERVFNQVSRALRRAIEDAGPPTAWENRAAA
jgi:hypothetical protein